MTQDGNAPGVTLSVTTEGGMRGKGYVASDDVVFRLPSEEPPPRGVKMLLLTPGGITVVGVWDTWALAWSPMPRIPAHIKKLLT